MDTDIWDTRYLLALFKAFIITLLLVGIFLFFDILYDYIFRGSFITVYYLFSLKLFYTDVTIIFTLFALYFVTKARDDFDI